MPPSTVLMPLAKRVDAVGVVAGVPLERELDFLAVLGSVEVADLGEQRLLRLVDVLDEVDDAAGVAVGDVLAGRARGARRRTGSRGPC